MEEQKCLVERSESEASRFGTMTFTDTQPIDGAGEQELEQERHVTISSDSHPDESNELLNCHHLDQFHEDALNQAGCGLSQVRVLIACGLAVGGSTLELAAIPFILPSAEIELCILPHEKNWLVLISLVGASFGALGWGPLAFSLGRRRALMSCLAVNAVFAAIAAFMPTYGTFMMARFCSAIGSGGIVPITYTYCGEMIHSNTRQRSLAVLLAASGLGALTSALLADATLPQTGALTLVEDKEHFSAWHRYLLLCTLPILAALVCLIWTQESPRYLLDSGREIDAVLVYQKIHNSNQIRVCSGKENTNLRSPSYHLGELSVPGKKRVPAYHVTHNIKMFWQAFFQLFSNAYRRTTLSLGGTLFFSMAIQFYLSSYIPASVTRLENAVFEASKRSIENTTFANDYFNRTLENIQYYNVTFVNCTFRDMLMSHVSFRNCSFVDVAFLNMKTSYTIFAGSQIVNSSIIDTELTTGRELQDCLLTNTITRAIRAACPRRPELAYTLTGIITEQTYVSHAMLIAAVIALLPPKLRPTEVPCFLCLLLSPSLYLVDSETTLYVTEAVYRLLLSVVFYNVCTSIVHLYPASVRCTAHGLILSVSLSGCAATRGAGAIGALSSAICTAALASIALLTTRLQSERRPSC